MFTGQVLDAGKGGFDLDECVGFSTEGCVSGRARGVMVMVMVVVMMMMMRSRNARRSLCGRRRALNRIERRIWSSPRVRICS